MDQYLNLLSQVRKFGARQRNRTGVDTFMIPGQILRFDCSSTFPAMTTKKLFFKPIVGELLGFIRGYTSAAQFRSLGCSIWDANANDPGPPESPNAWLKSPYRIGDDDLGRIYGFQWRNWGAPKLAPTKGFDQLQAAVNSLSTPTGSQSRRIIVSVWNPVEVANGQMALPPCHLLYQFLVTQADNCLHTCVYMRSIDTFLGLPFNIASYALLLNLVACATGHKVGTLTMFLADLHIYANHMDAVDEQLSRDPKALPTLVIPPFDNEVPSAMMYLELLRPNEIYLNGYESHPPIRVPMAV